jgi:phosphoribosylglycinamide formyltransferase 1
MGAKLKVGVLVSGTGTNLQALIDACMNPNYPAQIGVVVSNKQDAYALERARQANIPTVILEHKQYKTREAFDRAMDAALKKYHIEFVCLAGFMRLLSPWFVESWHNKLINTHPSLLPAFKGVNAQQQALDYGVKITGCTLHFVRSEMDVGPIIMQIPVPVKEGDTVRQLQERILVEEHRCYTQALRWIAEGKITIVDEHVRVQT